MSHWIFLRGLARHHLHWRGFVDDFQSQFRQAEIEGLDLCGNGDQNERASFFSIQEYVFDLRKRSRFIDQGKKVNLFTVSMGSMIGVEWARQFPHEVESLVCMNTSDAGTSPLSDRLRPFAYRLFLKMGWNHRNLLKNEKLVLELTTHLLKNPDEIATEFSKLKRSTLKNTIIQLSAAGLYRFPAQKPIEKIVLMSSLQDKMVSSSCTDRIAKKWNLTPIIHPEAGHDLTLDDPQWVLDQLQKIYPQA